MSFLDNLENNLKSLENAEQGGIDESKRREADRARSLASAPWAEKLKASSFVPALMQQATRAGFSRRTKINIMWIGTTLRLEARGQRLELRPTPKGVVGVFLTGINEKSQKAVDLSADPGPLLTKWLAILDEQKRLEDAQAPAEILDED
jgi:hypothetical protein